MRLVVLTLMSAILLVQQAWANDVDRGVTTTTGFSHDVSNVPFTQLSNLYSFGSRPPSFSTAMAEAERKASTSRNRWSMSGICKNDFASIVNKADPAPIQPKSLTEILAATNRFGISEENVRYTLAAYQSHEGVIRNNRYVTVVEYGRNANRPRLFVIDLVTANIRKYNVTHGANSGSHGGPARSFSNRNGSHQSSIGCALTGGFYGGKHGTSMRFHGLEVGKNDNMCVRSVVMHDASYAASGGRSHGCPAVRPQDRNEIYGQIQGGSMYCAFGDRKDNQQLAADEDYRPRKKQKRSRRRG